MLTPLTRSLGLHCSFTRFWVLRTVEYFLSYSQRVVNHCALHFPTSLSHPTQSTLARKWMKSTQSVHGLIFIYVSPRSSIKNIPLLLYCVGMTFSKIDVLFTMKCESWRFPKSGNSESVLILEVRSRKIPRHEETQETVLHGTDAMHSGLKLSEIDAFNS